MTADRTFVVLAYVHASERAVWQEAAARLQAALGSALRIDLLLPAGREGGAAARCDLACVSLLPDLLAAASWPDTEASLRRRLGALHRPDKPPPCIATVFRHLPHTLAASLSADGMGGLERVRRLNLLAARLSQETGITVIDLDRALAHAGAHELGTDCHLGGRPAQHLAAAAVAMTWLDSSLDGLLPDPLLESARQALAAARLATPGGAPPPAVLARLHGRGLAPDAPIESLATAQALLAAGDIDGAEAVAKRLRAVASALADGFIVHARCAEARRDWDEAAKRWRLCLDRFPGQAGGAPLGLAAALMRLGRFAEARPVWEAAHAAAPDSPQPLAGLANLAARAQEYARAAELYRRAIAAMGDKPALYWRMDLARVLLANGEAAAASSAARAVLDMVADFAPAVAFIAALKEKGVVGNRDNGGG